MAASTGCLELPSPGSFPTRSFQKAETQARHHSLGPPSRGEAAGASQETPQPTAHQHWSRDLRSSVLATEPGGGEAGMYSACGGEASREEADRRPPLFTRLTSVPPGPAPGACPQLAPVSGAGMWPVRPAGPSPSHSTVLSSAPFSISPRPLEGRP